MPASPRTMGMEYPASTEKKIFCCFSRSMLSMKAVCSSWVQKFL